MALVEISVEVFSRLDQMEPSVFGAQDDAGGDARADRSAHR